MGNRDGEAWLRCICGHQSWPRCWEEVEGRKERDGANGWNETVKSDRVHSPHWKVQVVPEDENSSANCLHCEINDLVQEYIEGQEKVDIVDLAARMAESLVELILLAPEEEQGKLLAATIAHLGNAFLEKSGAIEGDSNMTH